MDPWRRFTSDELIEMSNRRLAITRRVAENVRIALEETRELIDRNREAGEKGERKKGPGGSSETESSRPPRS
jgi:hypothetical protein